LRELAQLVARQQLAQLRLPDENDLQQLARVGFQVGQQPYLLEHRWSQVLRFIDYDHDASATRMRPQQIAAEDVHQVLEAIHRLIRHPDTQLLEDGQQELGRGHLGVEDQGNLGVLRRLRQQGANDRGFARADLAGQLHEAARLIDAVQQVSKGFSVALAQI